MGGGVAIVRLGFTVTPEKDKDSEEFVVKLV